MKTEYKIILYLALIIFTFFNKALIPLFIVAGMGLVFSCFFAFKSLKRSAKFVFIIVVFTFLSNLFFHHGQVIYECSGVYITHEGLSHAAHMTMRILILIIGAQILNATTSSDELIRGVTRLIGPLGRLKVIQELLMTTALTLTFLPSILDEVKEICSHCGKNHNGFRQRIKYVSSLIVEFLIKKLKEGEDHKEKEVRKTL
jgi:energy-coupling factor transport system permease protein